MARIYKRRIILLLNWQPCKCRAAFFAAKKAEKEKKSCKKTKTNTQKNLKKEPARIDSWFNVEKVFR